MKHIRALLALLLSGLLVWTPTAQPFVAYAQVTAESHEQVTSEAGPDIGAVDSNEDVGAAESATNGEVEPSSAVEGAQVSGSSAENSEPLSYGGASSVDEAGISTEVAQEISPNDAFQYVYIDAPYIGQGSTQHIVMALADANASVSEAKLELVAAKTGEVITLEASKLVDNTALFDFVTNDATPTDTYSIAKVSYRCEGEDEALEASFSGISSEAGDYRFDVVTAQLADQLAAGTSDNQGVTAYAIDGDGDLLAADSVDDAIATADAAGVQESLNDATAAGTVNAKARSTVSSTRENYLIVAVNAGHGGDDSGAVGHGMQEKNLTLSISRSLVNELNTYTGVSAVMTRVNDNQYSTGAYLPSRNGSLNTAQDLQNRVDIAKLMGADVYVSVHINSTGTGGAYGAEVWVPNTSQYLVPDAHKIGTELGDKILAQLEKLGLYNRGTKVKSTVEDAYPDGSLEDWYGDIRKARLAGMPGIIVEHAFIDNASDASKLQDAAFVKQLGVADATGIAQQYNLGKASAAKAASLVEVKAHVADLGWENPVYDQKIAGTTGKNKGLQAYSVSLQNGAASEGGIQYASLVDGSWQSWVSNGATSGTTGKGVALQAVKMRLTGDAASAYDIYYRVHSAEVGWLDWAKNGAEAGTQGYGYDAQAIEVVVVKKGASAPGDTAEPFRSQYIVSFNTNGGSAVASQGVRKGGVVTKPADPARLGYTFLGWYTDAACTMPYSFDAVVTGNLTLYAGWFQNDATITYAAHVADIGWQSSVSDGDLAGTTGKNKAVEALKVTVSGKVGGGVKVRAHVADIGWQDWVGDGSVAGTTGRAKAIEALAVELTGTLATNYDVYYQVHCADFGWLGWAKNGDPAGSMGYGKHVEAIRIVLVAKGSSAPSSTSDAFKQKVLRGQAQVQDLGWLNTQVATSAGSSSVISVGTTGKAKHLETMVLNASSGYLGGSIEYNAHVENIGWQGWKSAGAQAGTVGKNLAIEAVRIRLAGELASAFDVYYRVHSSDIGWLGWTKNGASAGTEGYAKAAEMIQICLVPKGGTAPSTSTAFRSKTDYAIMGATTVSAARMVAAFKKYSSVSYPSVYAGKGAATIEDFAKACVQAANDEGVRAEVLFAQAMKETGWLKFGGQVKAEQCNFGGLGATNGGAAGMYFPDVYTGLLAQAQHLKAYASTAPLNKPLVDQRFNLVTRGIAPTLDLLDGRWAVPGNGYGDGIARIISML